MIKRSFIGLTKPILKYEALDVRTPKPTIIQEPKKVSLFLDKTYGFKDSISFKIGDKVKTGQKLSFSENSDAYVISSVTGKISSIETLTGDYGKTFTSVSIDVDDNEEIDDQFKTLAAEPTLDNANNFLSGVPGKPSFKLFSDPEKPINTIIVNGIDRDLLVATNQYVVKSEIDAVKNGIRILKKITGIDNVFMAVPQNLTMDAIGSGAQVTTVDSEYPATLPAMMMQSILGQILPAGKSCEDMGVCFLTAEAVASIGTSFEEGRIPSTKTVTFVNKDGVKSLVSAKIGTPVRDILNAFGVTLNEKDRLILGGPMTGATLYSEDFPVLADTDAIMVQDRDNIPFVSDYPCINCGECVRACPANVPVNMLVRFLEAGQYEEAADQYDLYSCIECGLCSYVCVSKMPVFHYIKLAKYELGRTTTAEATNA
jgi:electron transport complex protein RnfC